MPSSAPVEVSAIIVSCNTRAMTLDCLRDLFADLEGIPSEVIVVDNASTDGSADAIAGRFGPRVRLIRNGRNAGFAAASNIAMRAARGKYFLLLNSDAFVKAGAVKALAGYLDRHAGVAAVGPRLLNADGTLQRSCYRFPSPWRAVCENLLLSAAFPNSRWLGDYRAWSHDQERDVEMVIGACMLIRASVFEEVGPFDESFFLYAEETDLCLRMRQAGYRIVFLPSAVATHVAGGSGQPQAARVFQEFRSAQERFLRKHYGSSGLWIHRMMIIIGACLRIPLYWLLTITAGGKANRYQGSVSLWSRILLWTLGRRGPGLREAAAGQR